MTKRLLITGHQGYLGSVLTPLAVEAGYDVTGFETGYFADCTLVPDVGEVPVIRKDIRDLVLEDLEGFNAVVHLAALSNDPIGNLNPAWTDEINFRSSIRLAELAKAAGVERFLFSSSCIMYGMSEAAVAPPPTAPLTASSAERRAAPPSGATAGGGVVTEESPLDPKTEYARSKVKAERAITALAGGGFSPTFLRNGTIYGLSARMRFDTVLNNLVGSAVTTGKVVLHGDGTPWRPVAHIEDVSRAFLHVLQAPVGLVRAQAFNNGEDGMNHQIMELARTVVKTVPGCRLECLASPDADQRTYKTDFSKFARTFPDFRFRWTIEDGARELYEAFRAIPLTHALFTDRRFTRLKWLRYLLDTGQLDDSLRWRVYARI